jgi:hypothetical protein
VENSTFFPFTAGLVKCFLKQGVNETQRGSQGILGSFVRHGLKAIYDERLHVAEGMGSPAKVAPVVNQQILSSPRAQH